LYPLYPPHVVNLHAESALRYESESALPSQRFITFSRREQL
jgi:hypothetical protein